MDSPSATLMRRSSFSIVPSTVARIHRRRSPRLPVCGDPYSRIVDVVLFRAGFVAAAIGTSTVEPARDTDVHYGDGLEGVPFGERYRKDLARPSGRILVLGRAYYVCRLSPLSERESRYLPVPASQTEWRFQANGVSAGVGWNATILGDRPAAGEHPRC